MTEVNVEISDDSAESPDTTPPVVVVNTEPDGERVDAVTVELARENATLEAANERLSEEVAEVAVVAEAALETADDATTIALAAVEATETTADDAVAAETLEPDEIPGGRLHWAHRTWRKSR